MPSFDTVSEANMVEVKNAIDQANKDISNRFDFKGSDARIEQKDRELTAFADAEFQLEQLREVMLTKLSKRGVDVRFLDNGKIEKIGGDKIKQVIKIKNGIETEDAKKIVRVIKDSKLKVQASIQGDAVRVTGAKRDDLQAAMAMLKKDIKDLPLEFNNFRDWAVANQYASRCCREQLAKQLARFNIPIYASQIGTSSCHQRLQHIKKLYYIDHQWD